MQNKILKHKTKYKMMEHKAIYWNTKLNIETEINENRNTTHANTTKQTLIQKEKNIIKINEENHDWKEV